MHHLQTTILLGFGTLPIGPLVTSGEGLMFTVCFKEETFCPSKSDGYSYTAIHFYALCDQSCNLILFTFIKTIGNN